MEAPRVRLGELLVRAGLISAEQLEEALAEQRRVGKRLGSILVDSGLVSETQVTQILSQQLSIPWVSLHHTEFSQELLALVPIDVVERYCLIPIYVRRVRGLGEALYIAMDDPTNAVALTEVAKRSGMHVRAMIAPPSDIRAAIEQHYRIGGAEPEPPVPAANYLVPVEDDAEEDVPTGIHPRVLPPTAAATAARVTSPSRPPQPGSNPPVASPSRPLPVSPSRPPPASPSRPPAASSPGASRLPPPPVPPPSSSPTASRPPASSPAASPVASRPASASSPTASRPPASSPGRELSLGKPGGRARTAPTKAGARRMIALTLLDGTTIRLPSKGEGAAEEGGAQAPAEAASPVTARDIVSALRAAARGVDASEVLGENVRWEAMFAALVSVLLKKHLVNGEELLEELRKG